MKSNNFSGRKKQITISNDVQWRTDIASKMMFYAVCNSSVLHFEFLCDLLDSMSSLAFYSQVDFYVLDTGLTDKQKEWVCQKYRISVIQFDYSVYAMCIDEKNGSECARAFVDFFIPGYEFYFYLDTDVWIQDEYSLDAYIELAIQQGIGAANTSINMSVIANDVFYSRSIFPDDLYDMNALKTTPYVNSGVVCFSLNALRQYRELLQYFIEEKGVHYGTDFGALNVLSAQIPQVKILPCQFHMAFSNIKNHIRIQDGLLYVGQDSAGVIHLKGEKNRFLSPIVISNQKYLLKWRALTVDCYL